MLGLIVVTQSGIPSLDHATQAIPLSGLLVTFLSGFLADLAMRVRATRKPLSLAWLGVEWIKKGIGYLRLVDVILNQVIALGERLASFADTVLPQNLSEKT